MKYSVIVPTMWASKKIKKMIKTYDRCKYISEILIINNRPEDTIKLNSKKVREIYRGENIFVNPAWNLGVKEAKEDNIIIANDDIYFGKITSLLNKVKLKDGMIVGPDISCFDKKTSNKLKVEPIEIKNWGYGTFMIMTKKSYVEIPDKYLIWEGDNILFNNNNGYAFKGFQIETEMSETIKKFNLKEKAKEDLKYRVKKVGVNFTPKKQTTAFTVASIDMINDALLDQMNNHNKVLVGLLAGDPEELYDVDGYAEIKESKAQTFANKIKGDKIYYKITDINIDGVETVEGKKEVDPRINEVDFVIKTFERYNCLTRLLDSILRYYPDANITVLDDSENINKEVYSKYPSVNLIEAEFDIGVSEGRNRLVKATKNKYVLLLDDDFEFTAETNISKFLDVLKTRRKAGVVAGGIDKIDFDYKLKTENNVLRLEKNDNEWDIVRGVVCRKSECVLNFALFKRQVFKDILWDSNFKTGGEHYDFYYRFPLNKWDVYHTEDVKVDHHRDRSNIKYNKYANRRKKDIQMFVDKHNLDDFLNVEGRSYKNLY